MDLPLRNSPDVVVGGVRGLGRKGHEASGRPAVRGLVGLCYGLRRAWKCARKDERIGCRLIVGSEEPRDTLREVNNLALFFLRFCRCHGNELMA